MLKIGLIVFIILFGLIIIRFLMLPFQAQQTLISRLKGQSTYSYTVYSDSPAERQIHRAKIYKGFFSWDRFLQPEETQELVRILRDTANYVVSASAESPDATELIIIYFDKNGQEVGESQINADGEIQTSPGSLLGIGGYLNNRGREKIGEIIH